MSTPFFTEEHNLFRQTVKEFVEKEIIPVADEWEKNERIPKEIWKRMGDLGFLGINYEEKYGGMQADFWYTVVLLEEIGRCTLGGFGAAIGVHQYMSVAHLSKVGSDDLKQRYLAPAIAGTKLGALAITEPNTGSDVGNIRTRAVREGDHYVINGSKTFITNGHYSDFVTVACKTDPDAGVAGISLIVIDRGTPGFTSTKLKKMGWYCSDTAELSFDNVKVPVTNIVGKENMGFYYIMESFQLERLTLAIMAVEGAKHAIQIAMQYMKERETFGRSISKYQALRHKIVEMEAEVEAVRWLTYRACDLYNRGVVAVKECTMAKMLASELAKKVIDGCLQMFGGYGYMDDYTVSRMYRDARVGTIVAGTTEIMKEILSKMMFDGVSFEPVYGHDEKVPERKEAIPAAAPQPAADTTTAQKPEKARDIIRSLTVRFRPEKANGYETTFHFDIAGDNGGQFTVSVKDGKCSVTEGLQGENKCMVKAKDKNYEDVELGRANPQMAVMMGKIKISNVGEMMKFAGLFKRLF